MTTKLTLNVEKEIIETAQQYAKEHDKSLSEIIEDYLKILVQKKDFNRQIDPEIADLSDDIPIESVSDNEDFRFNFLKEKYIHE